MWVLFKGTSLSKYRADQSLKQVTMIRIVKTNQIKTEWFRELSIAC